MNRVATRGLLPDRTVLLVLGQSRGRRPPRRARPDRGRGADFHTPRRRRLRRRGPPLPGADRGRRRVGHARRRWPSACARRCGCERLRGPARPAAGAAPARGGPRPRPPTPICSPARPGSGKRRYADRFAAALLDCPPHRIETRTHPDLFVLEPEGQGILIEGARRLRRDLHLRPFEADRRVYLILDAHLLRDESANALLKSLEEPPEYGVFVLVSDHAERMLPTIRSRLQTVAVPPLSDRRARAGHRRPGRRPRGARQPRPRRRCSRTDPAAAERRRRLPRAWPGARPPTRPSTRPRPRAAMHRRAAASARKAEAEAVAARARRRRSSRSTTRRSGKALSKRSRTAPSAQARRAEWDELRAGRRHDRAVVPRRARGRSGSRGGGGKLGYGRRGLSGRRRRAAARACRRALWTVSATCAGRSS